MDDFIGAFFATLIIGIPLLTLVILMAVVGWRIILWQYDKLPRKKMEGKHSSNGQ